MGNEDKKTPDAVNVPGCLRELADLIDNGEVNVIDYHLKFYRFRGVRTTGIVELSLEVADNKSDAIGKLSLFSPKPIGVVMMHRALPCLEDVNIIDNGNGTFTHIFGGFPEDV